MANPMRLRIGWSILGFVSVVAAGCAGGGSSIDGSVPSLNVTRSISGVWRRYQIGIEGTRVSCPDPKSLLAPSTRELTINNIVVDTCGSSENLIFGAPSSPGRGRYHINSLRGTEDGSYTISGSSLVLVRDMVNGVYLKNLSPAQAPQRTVYSVTFDDVENTFRVVPVSQSVRLKKKDTSLPAFREDGSLIATNVTPVLNSDGTVNTIILPTINDVAVVNSDLSITVGPVADGAKSDDTPGFARIRAVENTFQFTPQLPGTVIPDPSPAP